MCHKCVNDENLCEINRDNVNCEKYTCNDLKVMCNLLVTASIIALLLIVSENVELNQGPMNKCQKREKMMPTRYNNCKSYVATRVLHFSAFITKEEKQFYLLCHLLTLVFSSILAPFCNSN